MIGKLRATVRELGPVDGLLYLGDQALLRLAANAHLVRYHFVAVPVSEPADPAARPRPGLEVRRLDRGDPAFAAMPLTPDVLGFRFAQPSICFGAFKRDTLIGYLWLCLGPYQEDEVRCRFVPLPAESAVWDYDVYIWPEHRLSRAFARLWEHAHGFLRERGITWTVSRISSYNKVSIAAHRRMGARFLGSAIFLRLGAFQIMIASVPPYVHVSLFGGGQPRLCLDVR